MKNFSLPAILDFLLTSFTVFLLAFVLLNYGIQKPYSYIMAVCIGLLTGLIALKYLTGKHKGIKLKKSEEQLCNQTLTQLCCYPKSYSVDLFEKLFEKKNLSPLKKYGGLFIAETKCVNYFYFSFDALTKGQIADCFNKACKDCKIVIWTDIVNKELTQFANKFNGRVVLYDGKKTFVTLKENNLLPQITCPVATNVKNKTRVKLNLFSKSRARKYLLFGVSFVIMSYFVYYKIYYLVFGCLFLLLSLLCRLFGYNEKEFTRQ